MALIAPFSELFGLKGMDRSSMTLLARLMVSLIHFSLILCIGVNVHTLLKIIRYSLSSLLNKWTSFLLFTINGLLIH